MKIIFYFIFFTCFFSNYLSQTNKLGYYISLQKITKECKACFKTYQFDEIDWKFDYSNCPLEDCIGQAHCFRTFSLITYMGQNMEYPGIVVNCEKIKNSVCSESNSGNHLWKQINKQDAVSTKLTEVNVTEMNFCDRLKNLNLSNEDYKNLLRLESIMSEIK